MRSINFLKDPCNGFVVKSAIISAVAVGYHFACTSPFEILSVMKKYLTLMCFVHLLLDAFPVLFNSIML